MPVQRGPHLLLLLFLGLAKSSTQCRSLPILVYLICDWRCRRNGKGLAYETNLSLHKSESQVVKISGLKPMSEMVQKMLKQQSTQRKCHHKSSEKTKPEQPSICCCANSLKTFAIVASSFTRYKPLRLLQICINKRPSSVGTTRD